MGIEAEPFLLKGDESAAASMQNKAQARPFSVKRAVSSTRAASRRSALRTVKGRPETPAENSRPGVTVLSKAKTESGREEELISEIVPSASFVFAWRTALRTLYEKRPGNAGFAPGLQLFMIPLSFVIVRGAGRPGTCPHQKKRSPSAIGRSAPTRRGGSSTISSRPSRQHTTGPTPCSVSGSTSSGSGPRSGGSVSGPATRSWTSAAARPTSPSSPRKTSAPPAGPSSTTSTAP